ncbi:hypothetical protein PSTG_11583 [Puccinia striiformis f. sp. tritici PST-78]|uniref:GCM domain-containing protein n=1 Tax=Puccinia striiformis f. sp. tritici PST-78 TaxID=1165861 RepID=A0A0L0V7F2_9BASI|nr:hypothetical protein PSTG_11583 [Puccinia striiformis f. sp. tritici PST-78]
MSVSDSGYSSAEHDLLPHEDEAATIPNNKKFFPPTGEEETFIDHDCITDSQGYPLYPNNQTVFVKPPEQVTTNFGDVGFPKTTGVEYRAKRTWRVTRIYCLGALMCYNRECQWVGSPPTARNGIAEYLAKNPKCPGAAGKCPGEVYHKSCDTTTIRVDENLENKWAILRHDGLHKHPWPASKKPDKLSKIKLKEEIEKNPTAGAFKLKLGKPTAPQNPFESVTNIHESFANSDRLRYHRRLILTELGINPEKAGGGIGDKFIHDMFAWSQRGLLIISSSYLPGTEHFTFQTTWMAERLITRNQDNNVYNGGLLSDVTYRFFETGYLLSTSMYCEETARWIPVQLSWIRGLTEEYYKIHFKTLFLQFLRPSFTTADRDTLVRQVVDFSLAQREGFISAYMDVFQETDRKKALGKLKGCHEHFRAQVTRVKRNRAVVPADQETDFQSKCISLLERPIEGGSTHEEKIDELRRLFPKTKRWIDWWTMADVEAMLFPTRRPMPLDDSDESLPETTNAQERKKCVMVGMVELFTFAKSLEADWHAVMRGVSIEYGSQSKGQQDLAISIGWQKPRKRNPHSLKKQDVNDGRAPDTTATLLPKSMGGRPKHSLNIDKSPFTTYISYSASSEPARRNRCWLAAALESLYALFNPLWLRGTTGLKKDIFTVLLQHFNSRITWELTLKGHIKSSLARGQSRLFDVASEVSPGSFIPGEFASCDLFLDIVLDPATRKNSSKKCQTLFPSPELFSIHESRTATCERLPFFVQDHPRPEQDLTVLRILPSMFRGREEEPNAVTTMIKDWTTDGIETTAALACKSCPVKGDRPSEAHHLIQRSKISFSNDHGPQHLYFFLELATIFDPSAQQAFMAMLDWPFKLELHGITYTLFSRGYWNGVHYWCKVLRSFGSVSGVWLHDDRENAGIARLINPSHASIAGPAAHTSWVFYSREWTPSEEAFVVTSISQMSADNPEAQGTMPFAQLGLLLKTAGNPIPTINSTSLVAPVPVALALDTKIPTALKEEDDQSDPKQLLKRKAPAPLKVKLKVPKVTSTTTRRASSRLATGS